MLTEKNNPQYHHLPKKPHPKQTTQIKKIPFPPKKNPNKPKQTKNLQRFLYNSIILTSLRLLERLMLDNN